MAAPLLKTYQNNEIEDFFVKYYLSQIPQSVSDFINGTASPFYEMIKISGSSFVFKLKSKQYGYSYFFDPLFKMYFEDEELCRRVSLVKGRIVFCPAAIFYHQHSHTTDSENQENIQADKLVSEKILRLKNISKSWGISFYGIFVITVSSVVLHILRGEFTKSWLHIRSFFITVGKLPGILKTRKSDLLYIKLNEASSL